jgi:hypothetical protein
VARNKLTVHGGWVPSLGGGESCLLEEQARSSLAATLGGREQR